MFVNGILISICICFMFSMRSILLISYIYSFCFIFCSYVYLIYSSPIFIVFIVLLHLCDILFYASKMQIFQKSFFKKSAFLLIFLFLYFFSLYDKSLLSIISTCYQCNFSCTICKLTSTTYICWFYYIRIIY